jgi:hypothetical protein
MGGGGGGIDYGYNHFVFPAFVAIREASFLLFHPTENDKSRQPCCLAAVFLIQIVIFLGFVDPVRYNLVRIRLRVWIRILILLSYIILFH